MQNMGGLMAEIQKLQAELKNKIIEVAGGGGAVKMAVNGHQEVVRVTVSPELLSENKKDMLEALLAGTFNRAIADSKQMVREEITNRTGFTLPNMGDMM